MAIEKNMDVAEDFQTGSMGGFGHNILAAAATSVSGRKYHAIFAIEDSVIDYSNAIAINKSDGDTTVTGLALTAGVTIILGSIKDISVTSGKILAYLITTD
jgi:hypothetical protein